MADISQTFGGDLDLSATGDLLMVDTDALTQQRVFRRLLTNAGDYLWQLAYGAGLGKMVGEPENQTTIENIIRSQIFAEASVARQPEPVISTDADVSGEVVVLIAYTSALTGEPLILSVPVNQNAT